MKIFCSRPGCPVAAEYVPVLRMPLKGKLIRPPLRAIVDLPLCVPHLKALTMREMLTPRMQLNFEAMARSVSRDPPDFDKAELRAIKLSHPDYRTVLRAKIEKQGTRN